MKKQKTITEIADSAIERNNKTMNIIEEIKHKQQMRQARHSAIESEITHLIIGIAIGFAIAVAIFLI